MTEHDPIEALLKATGRRPTVPADRTARVRDAAGTRWRNDLVRRTRRRRIGWVLSVAAAVFVVAAAGLGIRSLRSSTAEGQSGVRVERIANAVWARHGSIPILRSNLPLREGSDVPRNSEVTTAADALVALLAPTGHSLRLDSGTTLRVLSGHDFVLERGAVYVDSHGAGLSGGPSIRIDTPVGTIEDRGTQFEARWDDGLLSLRVREGVVTIRAAAGSLVAHAGEALRLEASGRVDRTEDAASGGAWAWAEAIAPTMEIEGRSLSDFLDWVVRERGVKLRFADTGLAARAPAIVLRGSITAMTLDEATSSVLATCGLSHRWEGGTLIVGATPEAPRAR